jgi:hypothetical protein
MGPAMGVQDPVKAALRTNKQSPISQHRHDLARRQCCKLQLIAGQQDPLAFLVACAMSHVSLAAFSAIGAFPSACKLPPPALQGGEPHPKLGTHLMRIGTDTDGVIKDL